MDFIVSLAHFCEVHGPTSILCTQILPISCLTCYPPPSATQTDEQKRDGHEEASSAFLGATTPEVSPQQQHQSRWRPNSEPHTRNSSFARRSHAQPPVSQRSALLNQHLHQQLKNFSLSSSKDREGRSDALSPESPHGASVGSEGFSRRQQAAPIPGFNSMQSDPCPNCSLSIPESVTNQLPDGAPGSPTKDGRSKYGSPVLRTREALVMRHSSEDLQELRAGSVKHASRRGDRSSTSGSSVRRPRRANTISEDSPTLHRASTESTQSSSEEGIFSSSETSDTSPRTRKSRTSASNESNSSTSPDGLHEHTLTYLSTRQPTQPDAYSLLRRASIRTLSCEQLPRAHSGPLFFGDESAGYTISYVFRLSDPCSRGRLRRYAFVCWAGRDERRAARAYKEVLQFFAALAGRIVEMVEKRENECSSATTETSSTTDANDCDLFESRQITPVSSFLSGRTVDPDGFPRRSEVRAKGLAELVGRDDMFVELHAAFVRLLAQLGRGLGGLPMGMVIDSGIRGEVGEVPTAASTTAPRKESVTENTPPKPPVSRSTSRKTPVERLDFDQSPSPPISPATTPLFSPEPAGRWDSTPLPQLVA